MPDPPAQLSILASLDSPKEITALAEANELPHRTAHQAVEVLEDKGIVTSHKEGRERIVTPASKALPGLARALLFDIPRDDWDRILHGDRPMQLHVLDRVGHARLIAEVCSKGRSTLYRTVEILGPAGVLVKRDGRWCINPRIGQLREFVAELARVQAHHRMGELDPTATLVWHVGPELLLRSTHDLESPHVHRGALSAFAEHGAELFLGTGTYYYAATRELDVADTILQGLLIEPESRINRSYCALLYEQEQPEDLEHKAAIYGLETEARDLVAYVETHEATEGFLPWDEHDRYRRQYGVA